MNHVPSTTWKQSGNVRQLQRFCVNDVSNSDLYQPECQHQSRVSEMWVAKWEGEEWEAITKRKLKKPKEKKIHIDEFERLTANGKCFSIIIYRRQALKLL